MTQARTRSYGVGSPSLPQLWLTAMLRALVVIVQSVVSTFQMKRNHRLRDWHTGPAHASLPRTKNDTRHQETTLAVPQDSPLPHRHEDLSSRKRAALSGTHSSTCGHADQWLPALHDCVAPAGMTTGVGNALSGSGPLVRVPREGGDPAITSTLVPHSGYSHTEQHGDMPPPPSGGGATRSERRSSPTGWGTALTFSANRNTVPHLDHARSNACARPSSPARGRTNPAPV